MAGTTSTYKILAQANSSVIGVATAGTLYTVPASTCTILSYVSVANRGSALDVFRVWFAVGGASDDPKQYIAYDVPIGPGESVKVGEGSTLGAADLIRVQAGTNAVSFTACGEEISP